MSVPHFTDDTVTLWHGDALDVLRDLDDASVDAVVTDPPYGLGFMGHQWDQPGQYGALRAGPSPNLVRGPKDAALNAGRYDLSASANVRFGQWCHAWTTECLRVLKPGGHLLAFGGARTFHRLSCAVEDAGFEIRDPIAWIHGSGFPKSLDVSKAIDRAAGAERTVIGVERVRDIRNGHGRGNGDGLSASTRGTGPEYMDRELTAPTTAAAQQWAGWGTALKPAFEPIVVGRKPLDGTVAANVLAHGTGALNVDGCRIPMSDEDRDAARVPMRGASPAKSGTTAGRGTEYFEPAIRGRWPANVVLDEHQAAALDAQTGTLTSGTMRAGTERQPRAGGTIYGADGREFNPADTYGDSGGASRFFYTAKAGADERVVVDGVAHPTVKPLSIMRWLVRLVTPPGGLVLEPFAGSGTTVEACVLEGMRCVAIEREPTYLPLITQRIHRRRDPVAYVRGAGGEPGLFDLLGGDA